MDMCGLMMLLALMARMVLMALMAMVPRKVMAAICGEFHCDDPASIRAIQACLTQLGCRALPRIC